MVMLNAYWLLLRLLCREKKWDGYLGRPFPLQLYITRQRLGDVSSRRCLPLAILTYVPETGKE